MKKLDFIFNGLMIGLLLAGLAGCRPATIQGQAVPLAVATSTGNPAQTLSDATLLAPATGIPAASAPGPTLSPTKTKKVAPTQTNYPATPDPRLTPDQWRNWPYVPTI